MLQKELTNRIKYSQNFLHSSTLVNNLLSKTSITKDDLVFEIGCGRGIITRELAKYCKKVVAFEIDPEFAYKTKESLADVSNAELKITDFLQYQQFSEPFKVFSNIPFNKTSEILNKLTSIKNPPKDIYVFIQKEAAFRFMGKTEGFQLSLLIRPLFDLSIIHNFSKDDFVPKPSVDVVLMRFALREIPLISAENRELYTKFIKYVVGQQKPNIKIRLKNIFTYEQLTRISSDLNLPLQSTVDKVTFNQWLDIFDRVVKFVSREKKLLIK